MSAFLLGILLATLFFVAVKRSIGSLRNGGWQVSGFGMSQLLAALFITLYAPGPEDLKLYEHIGVPMELLREPIGFAGIGFGGAVVLFAWIRLALLPRGGGIHRAPGGPLTAVSEFFSKRVRIEVLEPTVRDMVDEHIEALAELEATGRRLYLWKARAVVVRGYWAFAAAVVAQTPLSLAKWILRIWKAV
ncbi:MAG: hypothetical protein AAGN66_21105 [Acidobacteriota bacterium]